MRLGDICTKIGSGATPKGGKEAYKSSGIPLIRSQNVLDWSFTSNGLAFIDEVQATALANVEVKPRDVLLNITGDSVSRVCMVPDWCTPARVNQHVSIVRPGPDIDPTFLLCFLQSSKPLLLKLASSGATRNALTKGMIEGLEIELPSIETQHAIASLVGQIQQKLVLNQQTNDYLEQLLLARYDHLFSSKSSHNGTIADIGDVVGGATPSKKRPEYYCHDGIGWITPRDLSNTSDKFIAHGADDITQAGFDSCSVKKLPAGTVLFSSRAPIGYIAIATEGVTTNQGFKSVVPRTEIGTAFVYCFLVRNKNRIADTGSGTTFPEVSGKTMAGIELTLPDVNLCSEFEEWATPLLGQQRYLEEENRQLGNLRDALLPKLMSGEIDVSKVELPTQPNNHLCAG